MSITLDAITLPEDLVWQDEFAHDTVAQQLTRTEGGALIVEETSLEAGRPITLAGSQRHAWISRATLIALHTLSDTSNTEHLLTLNDGRTFDVMFARPGAIQAEPIVDYSTPASGDFYAITIKLITV